MGLKANGAKRRWHHPALCYVSSTKGSAFSSQQTIKTSKNVKKTSSLALPGTESEHSQPSFCQKSLGRVPSSTKHVLARKSCDAQTKLGPCLPAQTDTLVRLSTLAQPLLCIPGAHHREQWLAFRCLGELVVPRCACGILGQVPNATTDSVRSDPPTKKLQSLT